jgi:hypothetical protein
MTRRPLAAITAALAGVVLLAGCASQPDITAEAAEELQTSVVSIATLAQSDAAAALTELDALEGRLDAASADGSIQEGRATDIRSSIDLVRADLTAAVEAARVAAEQAAAEQAAADKAAADLAAEQAAADQAAADEAARQAADDKAENDKDAKEAEREAEKERREQEREDREGE